MKYVFNDPLGVDVVDSTCYPHILSALVIDTSKNIGRKICFDLNDGPEIALDHLKACDYYFKRTFNSKSVNSLDRYLKPRVLPYGLNYQCKSRHEKQLILKGLIHVWASGKSPGRRFQTLKRIVRWFVKKTALNHSVTSRSTHSQSLLISEFEAPPDLVVQPRILFQVKIYDPETLSGRPIEDFKRQMNDRANLVRALKKAFGKRFLGGVVPSAYARKHYPDCISGLSTDRRNYLHLVRECLVGVTTGGIHDSVGWKLPEYLAASKCVVSEPLQIELPGPLIENRHYLPFHSPGECIRSCRRLLDNLSFAKQMRQANYKYYQTQVWPPRKIWSCIIKSLTC